MTPINDSGLPVNPSQSALRPLGLNEVHITGGFWGDLQTLNGDTIIQHCLEWMERIGWISNFDHAAHGPRFEHAGVEFVDSEVYKLLEAIAWELGARPNHNLSVCFDSLVRRVAAAQDPDGYLHTSFGRPGQPPRWSDLEQGHELYCAGHLIQAAVARLRTGFDDDLPRVARALADHLWDVFGPAGRVAVCGHPEVEMALAEFARATGEAKYLELAALFIQRRGRNLLKSGDRGAAYYLDDIPVREAEVLRGHAVRALYLAAGAVDVATETGDEELASAIKRQWLATVNTRTYITGAVGSRHQDEAFGDDFELPSDQAYGETCAGIGSVMLSWRLLLSTGESKYADLMERTLFNNVLASPAANGRAFFYSNTLHQRTRPIVDAGAEPSPRAEAGLRAPWFQVSCCPTNVARTLASIAGYLVTATDRSVQIHQYADMDVRTRLHGELLELRVRTAYPFDDEIHVECVTAPILPIELRLRVPPFARTSAELIGLGDTVRVEGDHVVVERVFRPGDTFTLLLPQKVKRVTPDPRIDAIRGSVAFEKGPLVLALESTDIDDHGDVNDLEIVDASEIDAGGRIKLTRWRPQSGWPYGNNEQQRTAICETTGELRPYYQWGNRGPATMRVWLPVRSHPS